MTPENRCERTFTPPGPSQGKTPKFSHIVERILPKKTSKQTHFEENNFLKLFPEKQEVMVSNQTNDSTSWLASKWVETERGITLYLYLPKNDNFAPTGPTTDLPQAKIINKFPVFFWLQCFVFQDDSSWYFTLFCRIKTTNAAHVNISHLVVAECNFASKGINARRTAKSSLRPLVPTPVFLSLFLLYNYILK